MFHKTKLTSIILIILITLNLSLPSQIYARTWLQKIGHGFKRSITFVAKLPDKSTRWMGPVLGPIASSLLTHNLSTHSRFANVFNKARKAHNIIGNIEQQQALLGELKQAYADQAQTFTNTAHDIRQQRQDLASQLVDGHIDFDTYLQQAISLEKIAQTYDQAADDFQHRSETITEKTLINLVTKNATNTLLGQIKQATIFEVKQEINKLIRSDVITRLLDSNSTSSPAIDLLVQSELDDFFQTGTYDNLNQQQFKDRLRDKIKQLIKENKQDLQQNWDQHLQQAMDEIAQQLQVETNNLPSPPPDNKQPSSPTTTTIPKDAHGCYPGYEWSTKVGDCIQTNCNSIDNAHYSYTLDCVCGSSGSMEENPNDPNKECSYSKSHASCPGCVYACVGIKDDCPLDGIGN